MVTLMSNLHDYTPRRLKQVSLGRGWCSGATDWIWLSVGRHAFAGGEWNQQFNCMTSRKESLGLCDGGKAETSSSLVAWGLRWWQAGQLADSCCRAI